MRGGGSAKGRSYAAARYARWWVGLSGAPPKRASGMTHTMVTASHYLKALPERDSGAMFAVRGGSELPGALTRLGDRMS